MTNRIPICSLRMFVLMLGLGAVSACELIGGYDDFSPKRKDGGDSAEASDCAHGSVADCGVVTVEITSPAKGATLSTHDVSVVFSVSGPGALRAKCQLDSRVPLECTSPHAYTGVVDGPHTVTVMGTNFFGMTDSATTSFTIVTDDGNRVTQVTTGGAHTCELHANGGVQCWGRADHGQLGYGNINSASPDDVPTNRTDVYVGGEVVQVAAGRSHTCARLATGTVRCWGSGSLGQLGYGNTANIGDNELPSSAGDVNIGGPVVQIAAGAEHTCALLAKGTVRCWGNGSYGRLGYGTTKTIGDDELPSSAGDVDVGGSVIQIAAGGAHTCALLSTGTVRCWGWGSYIGYANFDTIGDDEVPASAGDVEVGGPVRGISTGSSHSCAFLLAGTVRCWGGERNPRTGGTFSEGQLGYGNTQWLLSPGGDVSVGGKVVEIAAGGVHTCALLATGNVRCWGRGDVLGYGNANTIGDDELPSSAGDVDVGGPVLHVAAGEVHTCALLSTGAVRCWGHGEFGQLGYYGLQYIGTTRSLLLPEPYRSRLGLPRNRWYSLILSPSLRVRPR